MFVDYFCIHISFYPKIKLCDCFDQNELYYKRVAVWYYKENY